MRGKIIVIEGTDCSGKETQSALLIHRLLKEGVRLERFSFPMYDTPTGKIIGGPYLGKEYLGECLFPEGASLVDPKVAALYYAADRRYNMERITTLLDNGVNVLLDRYVESNMAHQGGKIFDKDKRLAMYDWLDTLEYKLLGLERPAMTVFLHMPYDVSSVLRANRSEPSDQHENNELHLKNAEKAYLELADIRSYHTIKCVDKKNKLKRIEDIHEDVYKIIKTELVK